MKMTLKILKSPKCGTMGSMSQGEVSTGVTLNPSGLSRDVDTHSL